MPVLDEYGRDVSQPMPGQDVANRIGAATAEGWRSGGFLTPKAEAEARAANAQTWMGRNVVQPLVDLSNVPLRGVGALSAGTGQAAYEAGAAISPELGRDLYMLNQVAPAIPMARPGGIAGPGLEEVRRAPSAPDAIADIGAAPDVDGAITAAGRAVGAPVAAADADLLTQRAAPGEAGAALEAGPARVAAAEMERPPAGAVAAPPAPPETLAAAGPPTTSAAAKAIASGYYRREEALGGNLKPNFTNDLIDRAEALAPQTEEGRIFTGDTALTSLVDRMQGLRDHSLSLQAAQEIDEALGSMIDKEHSITGLSKEGKHMFDLQSTMRDMIENAGENDVEGGTEGFAALGQARIAWSQAMKMADVERIIARAELTDNPATSIKSGIRVLLSNPSRVRGYAPEEIAALKDAANRGVVGGVLHVFGNRLAPIIAGGAGFTGGPVSGLMTAGLTHIAGSYIRDAATALAERRAQNVLSVIGSGVPPEVADAIVGSSPSAAIPLEPRAAAPASMATAPELPPEAAPAPAPVTRDRAAVAAMKWLVTSPPEGTTMDLQAARRILIAAYGEPFVANLSRAKLSGILANFAAQLRATESGEIGTDLPAAAGRKQ
jgi:hypothetical protein